MLRVLMTSTSYPRSDADWQGIFIRRMADALAVSPGLALRVWAPAGPLHPDASSACSAADRAFLARLQEEGGIAHLLRSDRPRALGRGAELLVRLHLALRRQAAWPGVLHVNWLQCVIAAAGRPQPVLATVLGSDLALLEKPVLRHAIRQVLRARRAVVCPNADWMVPPLRAHLGDVVQEVRCVPFGLDRFWFDVERRPAPGRHVWLTVLRVTRKKIGALFEWTRDMDRSRHEFHLFGPMQEQLDLPEWIHYHGAATPQQLATEWYPRASGMISLSEHDEGRPQVLLEAMAAGVPLVCSPIPAHADLLRGTSLGILVADQAGFGQALERLADPAQAAALAAAAKAHVREAFGTWDDCAARYASVYRQLLEED